MATRRMKVADGVEVEVQHFGGDGPPAMLVHATGFHGQCWEPLAECLTPEFGVWSLDQRGHGASSKPPDGRYDWARFADDLLAVIANLGEEGVGLDGWRGLGHSMGGAVLLTAEARRPGTFASLALYEPVVITPDWDAAVNARPGRPNLADIARRRRPSFDSRQAALDNYRSKPPFNAFHRAALDAYVQHGFVNCPDGTVTLACAREDEAAVFDAAPTSGAWSVLHEVRCPVTVMSGTDPSEPLTQIAGGVARQLPRGGFRLFEGLDHFGPMVDPEGVAKIVAVAFTLAPGHGPGLGDGGGEQGSTFGVSPPS